MHIGDINDARYKVVMNSPFVVSECHWDGQHMIVSEDLQGGTERT